MADVHLTRKGYRCLHAELRELIEVRRPQVMADLIQAREYGDLRENAEYETAKRDQGMIEGRIHALEALLSSVDIIELPRMIEAAIIGTRICVENLDTRQVCEYLLVSEAEAHLEENYLSVESLLGRALLGTRTGEEVTYAAPAGTRKFKVLDICAHTESDE